MKQASIKENSGSKTELMSTNFLDKINISPI